VQAELVRWITTRTLGLDDATLRRSEAPGKWSIIEVVQHLADTELAYGYRVRMVLTHDAWPMEVYDRDAWARDLRYRDSLLPHALDQLRALRAANLRLYRSLTDADLARAGMHVERGAETVATMIRLLAGHDLVHRRQIDRIMAAR
ncbi:MAG: DinB family protein, partial [Gemmatimonadales bacterium]|nr:DinB family protein [Gemmatimonadales bacterium]